MKKILVTSCLVLLFSIKVSCYELIIFFSTDCPICITYISELRNLISYAEKNGIKPLFVYPNRNKKKNSIAKFHKKMNLKASYFIDKKHRFTKKYDATVTPEVFLLDNDGVIFYRGKVDNLYEGIGKRRHEASEHYLRNAIDSLINGKKIIPQYTEAVGCAIFLRK